MGASGPDIRTNSSSWDVVCITRGQKDHIKGAPFCRKDGHQESDSSREEEVTAAVCSSVQLYNYEE